MFTLASNSSSVAYFMYQCLHAHVLVVTSLIRFSDSSLFLAPCLTTPFVHADFTEARKKAQVDSEIAKYTAPAGKEHH